MSLGLGGRTCVGYGSSDRFTGQLLFECSLEGQGPAAKLLAAKRLDGTPEFRPTMFRAAIRGMALRLFGGVTDAKTARLVVSRLFGSISPDDDKEVNVGLLATSYTDATWELEPFGSSNHSHHTYATSGRLQWRQMRAFERGEDERLVAELLAALHGITLSLGGFGRSWRRPDHRIFRPRYAKSPIGCHWQWRDVASLPAWVHVQSPEALSQLLQRSRQIACDWLQATGQSSGPPAAWREVLHPQRTRIWTRTATGPDNAAAISWFHQAPMEGDRSNAESNPLNLKGTLLAGQMNQVGLIWNRLLPLLEQGRAPQTAQAGAAKASNTVAQPGRAAAFVRPARPGQRPAQTQQPRGAVSIAAHQGRYLESLLLHPLPRDAHADAREHHQRFIEAMKGGAGANFQHLDWS
ncbi:MAG: hypothetical protein VKN56_11545 [Cyanobacteriota bacterium]|nr:hypothetical protein [Cyanobacteriota bacterium]